MAGVRVLAAAVCLLLAAAPAVGQGDGRHGLEARLDALAREIGGQLNIEARSYGKRLRVVIRPAWTEPEDNIRLWCGPLSFGLRDMLHERIDTWRRDQGHDYDMAMADHRQTTPPEVSVSWTREGARVRVEARVWMENEILRRVPSVSFDAGELNDRQRNCLFSFRGGERLARVDGFVVLREDPTLGGHVVRRFMDGGRFHVIGELTSVGGAVWSVVWSDDPGAGSPHLFATGLTPPPATPGVYLTAAVSARDRISPSHLRAVDAAFIVDGEVGGWPAVAGGCWFRPLEAGKRVTWGDIAVCP